MLKSEDFLDDAKDAGEIGAGHTVTAVYEIVPPGVPTPAGAVRPSKYAEPASSTSDTPGEDSAELLTVRLRYKPPGDESSTGFHAPVADAVTPFEKSPADVRFAAAVASFGMLLRDSRYKGASSFDEVARMAEGSKGSDTHGYRAEFVELVRTAASAE